jgi:hypothetical protein
MIAPRPAPTPAAHARAVSLLAATLHAEGAGLPVRAIEALAAVVANRARLAAEDPAARLRFAPAAPGSGPVPWPALVAAACRAPFLFAAWRDAATRAALAPLLAREVTDDHPLAACRRIAARAVARTLADPTAGATHWHPADALPPWTRGRMPVAEVAGLVLYRIA